MPKIPSSKDTRSFTVSIDRKTIEKRINTLIEKTQENALKEIFGDRESKDRIKTAISKRFKPYILEAEIIAQQLLTPEYQQFKAELRDFFNAVVNVVACPDGRISILSLTDPRSAYVHRVPRGQLPTRLTTGRREVTIPANIVLRSGIWTVLKRVRKKLGIKKPRFITLIGPHIHSVDPTHGCGGAAEDLSGVGSGMPIALATLHFGGARNYFRILQASQDFWAFDNYVRIAGGVGSTIDYTHDIHSQGVIIGLGYAWKHLKKGKSLRKNLLRLHKDKKIVMSELLVNSYKNIIHDLACKFDSKCSDNKSLNYRNPMKFAYNAMLIGRIAKELTIDQEKRDFDLLPKMVRNKYDKTTLCIAVYHTLRNVVYQVLGDIKPGGHWLIRHPEQLLRVGPIGADFNVKTIAFIETTPPTFSASDMNTAFVLYKLMEKFLPSMDVDLRNEARVIMVTAGFDHSIYANEEAIEEEYDRVKTMVIDNAANLKTMVKRAVQEGATVVIPMIHHLGNRSVIDVV